MIVQCSYSYVPLDSQSGISSISVIPETIVPGTVVPFLGKTQRQVPVSSSFSLHCSASKLPSLLHCAVPFLPSSESMQGPKMWKQQCVQNLHAASVHYRVDLATCHFLADSTARATAGRIRTWNINLSTN